MAGANKGKAKRIPKRPVKRTPARSGKRKSTKPKATKRRRCPRCWWLLRWGLLLGIVAGAVYVGWLDYQVRERFEGKRWSLPAQVYASPMELYSGKSLTVDEFLWVLKGLGYRHLSKVAGAGSFSRRGSVIHLHSRPFRFWDGHEVSRNLRVRFKGSQLLSLLDSTGKDAGIVRLDPLHMGGIYPGHKEDRVLVRLDEVPKHLTEALIEVEDRNFYQHHGIAFSSIARAFMANIRAGHVVQGGSTLTQQLVKNFFLTSQRTLGRKLNEAIMALLLEWHYDKQEILEAYMNEVYLGQAGKRAIHGFGLASWFYFQRPLAELDVQHTALLVALMKGASYYNPRRHPQRAKQRRNLVLNVMQERGLIKAAVAQRASRNKLGVTAKRSSATSRYSGYLDLVRRQLIRDYEASDLSTEGLRIFTNLDSLAQRAVERSLAGRLRYLEKRKGIAEGVLQGAVVMTSAEGGRVMALAGGRDPGFAGFNRALDASRQVGSLIKPAVYLSALLSSKGYTLATLIEDEPLHVPGPVGEADWSPKNANGQYHGGVLLHDALVHSYNPSTARLGLDVGINSVIDTLRALGVEREISTYPSMLLGATPMSPLQVAQMYQTLASNGFVVPLNSIAAVMSAEEKPLKRYPLELSSRIDPAAVYLIKTVMHDVTQQGTARYLSQLLPAGMAVAGKTGTTDGLRDSWFAGFSGDRVVTVWVGRDDNRSAKLSGASGAMLVWADILRKVHSRGLQWNAPAGVVWRWIERSTGYLADEHCADAAQFPFLMKRLPSRTSSCVGSGKQKPLWDESPESEINVLEWE